MCKMPLITLLILLPFLGSLILCAIPPQCHKFLRNAALTITILNLGFMGYLYCIFDLRYDGFQFVEKELWMPSLNISYHVGIDGLSLAMLLLTAFIMPVAILYLSHTNGTDLKKYLIAFMLLQLFVTGTFCALDLIMFYICFESILIPMFFIIAGRGGMRRIYASYKFFLYTLFGSLLMLAAIVFILLTFTTSDYTLLATYAIHTKLQIWLGMAFFIAFAIKIPMFPLHTWLPDAHVQSMTSGSIVLAAILLKLGGYGFLRLMLPLFPYTSAMLSKYVMLGSAIGVIYASIVAFRQTDIKKTIAYSSIAHMGIVTFGIFMGTEQSIQGSIFQMLSHGVISAALFLCVGMLYERLHTRDINSFGGLYQKMPVFAALFLIASFASIGLPGTCGFVGEIVVLLTSFKAGWYWTALLGSGMVLSAVYMLTLYKKVMLGSQSGNTLQVIQDCNMTEKLCLYPLILAVVLLGLYPNAVFQLTQHVAHKTAYSVTHHIATKEKNPC